MLPDRNRRFYNANHVSFLKSACLSARLQYLYAFNIVPMKVMDPSELVKQPQDVTEKPFSPSADTNRQKTSFGAAFEEVTAGRWPSRQTRHRASSLTFQPAVLPAQEPPRQFFYDLNRKQGGGRGRKRPSEGEGRGPQQHHDRDGHHRGQPKQPRRPRESCDTCGQCVWILLQIGLFVHSSAFWSLLVLPGQPSGGETPRHQHRDTREFQSVPHATATPFQKG